MYSEMLSIKIFFNIHGSQHSVSLMKSHHKYTKFQSPDVKAKFDEYPVKMRTKLLSIRELIFSVATQTEGVGEIEETLKWGEPSYLCKTGSTVRIHWQQSDSEYYRVFFHCQTTLISTFRELYPHSFDYEGNRAIRLELKQEPDLGKLEHCIELSLRYHTLKNLPRLGT